MPLLNEAAFAVMEGLATPEAVATSIKPAWPTPWARSPSPTSSASTSASTSCACVAEGLGDPKYRPCPLLSAWSTRLARPKTGGGFYAYAWSQPRGLTPCLKLEEL